MLKKIDVAVTSDDIRNGRRHDCMLCPIALAISRTLLCGPTGCGVSNRAVSVFIDQADSQLPVGDHFALLPDEAALFTRNFDRGRDVSPFKFTLHFEHVKEEKEI